jgi:four helix bundle protein
MATSSNIRRVQDLEVYRAAVDDAMTIFEETKRFPREEMYSLTDQIRRSSRSVAANLSEAWRKRRYHAAFISKLSDAETEAGETQTWIEFAVKCKYTTREDGKRLYKAYDGIIGRIVRMIDRSDDWIIRDTAERVASPRPRVSASPRRGGVQ